jgi:ribonuclease P protein component
MAGQFTLGKKERLKSRKSIEQLFDRGKSFSVVPFRVHYLLLNKPQEKLNIRFGVGVPGKNFKKATDRNRIKRLTRETYRLQKPELQKELNQENKQMNLFFVYTGKGIPEFKKLKEKVNLILNRLITLIHENNSSNP